MKNVKNLIILSNVKKNPDEQNNSIKNSIGKLGIMAI